MTGDAIVAHSFLTPSKCDLSEEEVAFIERELAEPTRSRTIIKSASELADEREIHWRDPTFRMSINRRFGKRARLWSGLPPEAAALLKARINKRAQRERLKTSHSHPARSEVEAVCAKVAARLKEWQDHPDARLHQIVAAGREDEIKACVKQFLRLWAKTGKRPSHADLAVAMAEGGTPMTRRAAQNRVRIMDDVFGALNIGPWAEGTGDRIAPPSSVT